MASIVVSPNLLSRWSFLKKRHGDHPAMKAFSAKYVMFRTENTALVKWGSNWYSVDGSGVYPAILTPVEELTYQQLKADQQRLNLALFETSDAKLEHQLSQVKLAYAEGKAAALEEENIFLKDELRKQKQKKKSIYKSQFGWIFTLGFLYLVISMFVTPSSAAELDKTFVELYAEVSTLCWFDIKPRLRILVGEGVPTTDLKEHYWDWYSTINTGDVRWDLWNQHCESIGKGSNYECLAHLKKHFSLQKCATAQDFPFTHMMLTGVANMFSIFTFLAREEVGIMLETVMFIVMNWPLNIRLIIVSFVLRFVCGAPMVMINLTMTWFPVVTLFFYGLMLCSPPEAVIAQVVLHWLVAVITAMFEPNNTPGVSVSYACMNSLLLPLAYFFTFVVSFFGITPVYQILLIVVVCTWKYGVSHSFASVTINNTDGTTTRTKAWNPIKSAKDFIVKLQNRMHVRRGIIPKIPWKGDSVVRIQTRETIGNGWRCGNYFWTIGHNIPESEKVCTINWKENTGQAKVKNRFPLGDTGECLVQLSIPGTLTGVPPLKLTKSRDSGYGALYQLNDEMYPEIYLGWLHIDGTYITTCFDTEAGSSGAPYVDQFGRFVGVHFGHTGLAMGLWCVPYFDIFKEEGKQQQAPKPPTTTIVYCWPDGTTHEEPFRPQEDQKPVQDKPSSDKGKPVQEDVAKIVQEQALGLNDELTKLIVTTIQHNMAPLVGQINELRDQLHSLSPGLIFEQKKKHKTKNKRRVMALGYSDNKVKVFRRLTNIKARMMKSKVLTEEEYEELQRKGKSPDEIRKIVTDLRWKKWEEFCKQHNVDPHFEENMRGFEDYREAPTEEYEDEIQQEVDQWYDSEDEAYYEKYNDKDSDWETESNDSQYSRDDKRREYEPEMGFFNRRGDVVDEQNLKLVWNKFAENFFHKMIPPGSKKEDFEPKPDFIIESKLDFVKSEPKPYCNWEVELGLVPKPDAPKAEEQKPQDVRPKEKREHRKGEKKSLQKRNEPVLKRVEEEIIFEDQKKRPPKKKVSQQPREVKEVFCPGCQEPHELGKHTKPLMCRNCPKSFSGKDAVFNLRKHVDECPGKIEAKNEKQAPTGNPP